MSQTIEVEAILRLDLKPDETLVIVLPDDLDDFQRTAKLISDTWQDSDRKVLVVNSRVDLTVAETRSLENLTAQVT